MNDTTTIEPGAVGAVAIGRNEGARLIRCLETLMQQTDRVIYVDSGSTDGSRNVARRLGAEVIELDMDHPFTAARARNAGVNAMRKPQNVLPEFIQFVDGDCELRDGWIGIGRAWLEAHSDVAVACGRRRERHPENSLYNRLIDLEWDTPVGRARSCGGDALMRTEAFQAVDGFDPRLIAGEEPELCVRLRAAGWTIWRLDAEMTWHDAGLTRLGQWWARARRAGHAFAEGAALHGRPPERHNVTQVRRSLAWGVALPLAALLGAALIHPAFLLVLLTWLLQVIRLAWRTGGWVQPLFLTLAKMPEAQGITEYHLRRLLRRRRGLIEYK
ncbi:mycofactocin system glycosyltransferase [Jannaschia seosinensis]|uniref:Mycofactocin system glycosyltransferase n=1 Tax=Jannaschia seosinensis TaxID=313367 RepID=A0A0M7B759_9RHOB|nr:glycosyltransferase family A protein [Jannaschia seosinensis]CUH20630.1 mycofactocin system glycosyltransferase [Jannaschia seosinensis]